MSGAPLHEQLQQHEAVMRASVAANAAAVEQLAAALVACFNAGGKLLLFGNGGSAADAQHIAAEFVNRFAFDRPALPALALTTDSSVLTCIANDASYEQVFARQVQAFAKQGDVVIGISTSGGSRNVQLGLMAAREAGAMVVGFTGARGREPLGALCDLCLAAESSDTARIQEVHAFLLHVVAGLAEARFFARH